MPMTRLLLALLVVLTTTACADRSATQYVGSVTRADAPERAGSLRLTLFSRTDTSFSGVIELGAPARGTGGAYAWFEGPVLHLMTVGQEAGDTIHWTSRRTDAELGGRFEVTGGARAGQQGTWRARLVKGLPASPATLRIAPSAPLPPATALWPAVLLLAVIAGAAHWVRRAPRLMPVPPDASPDHAPPPSLAGIGGWLLLFAFAQLIAVIRLFAGAGSLWSEYIGSMGIAAAMPGMPPLLVLETGARLLTVPAIVGGLLLIFRRSRYAPRYWFAYFALSSVYLLVDLAATAAIRSQLERFVTADMM